MSGPPTFSVWCGKTAPDRLFGEYSAQIEAEYAALALSMSYAVVAVNDRNKMVMRFENRVAYDENFNVIFKTATIPTHRRRGKQARLVSSSRSQSDPDGP